MESEAWTTLPRVNASAAAVAPFVLECVSVVAPETFVVEITMQKSGRPKLKVALDTDEGVDLERCGEVVAALREALCAAPDPELQKIGTDYEIEVGSPGVGNPLRHPRQYRANIGRTVRLLTVDNETVEGKIVEADDQGLTVELKATKKRAGLRRTFEAQRIAQAKIIVSFND
jgi:ribosome maturation factor RimP